MASTVPTWVAVPPISRKRERHRDHPVAEHRNRLRAEEAQEIAVAQDAHRLYASTGRVEAPRRRDRRAARSLRPRSASRP
jgi:hypothetical protein